MSYEAWKAGKQFHMVVGRNLSKLVIRCNLAHPHAGLAKDLLAGLSRKAVKEDCPDFKVSLEWELPVDKPMEFVCTFPTGQKKTVHTPYGNVSARHMLDFLHTHCMYHENTDDRNKLLKKMGRRVWWRHPDYNWGHM